MNIKFPYSRPNVTETDLKAVKQSLKGQFLTGGNIIGRFENALSKEFNVTNTLICNSGTAALHLIYMSLGLKKGDTILTSPITFIATANAALMCGAKVVFADVDPLTGMVTPQTIEKVLKDRKQKIKIITVVHMGGRLCDLEEISKLAKKYDCFLVEDACHAPGATYYNKKNIGYKVGSCKYSIASSFSFHAIKNITMAEGGCVTTNNKKITDYIRLKLNHSIVRKSNQFKKNSYSDPWYYKVQELGYNYRASEINCALGLSQLKRLKKSLKIRNSLANLYKKELHSISEISFPKNAFCKRSNAWHLFTLLINFKKIRLKKRDFFNELNKKGIGVQVHYIPLFLQPLYKNKDMNNYKGALSYYEQNVSLPMYVGLRKKDIIYICNTIKNIISQTARKKEYSK